jgi:hypothetical protein
MMLRRRALGTTIIALVVVAVVIITATGVLLAMNRMDSNGADNPASSVSTFKTNNTWNFTVSINSSSVIQGQPVQLVAQLTNISPTSQTIQNYVEPYINPMVYPSGYASANGTVVWAWNPPEEVWATWTVQSGHTLVQTVNIPTSELGVNQTYTIEVVPLSGSAFTAQSGLGITIQFSIH